MDKEPKIEKENNPVTKKLLIFSIIIFIIIVILTIVILSISGNNINNDGSHCDDGGTCPIHLLIIKLKGVIWKKKQTKNLYLRLY